MKKKRNRKKNESVNRIIKIKIKKKFRINQQLDACTYFHAADFVVTEIHT